MKKGIIGIIMIAIAAGIGWYAYQHSPLKLGNRVIVETVEAAEHAG